MPISKKMMPSVRRKGRGAAGGKKNPANTAIPLANITTPTDRANIIEIFRPSINPKSRESEVKRENSRKCEALATVNRFLQLFEPEMERNRNPNVNRAVLHHRRREHKLHGRVDCRLIENIGSAFLDNDFL